MMKHVQGKTDSLHCCGCTACEKICPVNAIQMTDDSLGFKFPVVNEDICLQCGKCVKVCQYSTHGDIEKVRPTAVYAFRLKNNDELFRSQSGGAFFAIAHSIAESGGVIYGAAFDNKWHVYHKRVDYFEGGIFALRGTKYVQSDLNNCFELIYEDLKNNLKVLFTGTPCQVAGLKSFIPLKLQENLLCVDIFCHGVPSPKIWSDYLQYLKDKHHSDITNACFRDKRFGWHGAIESFKFSNGKETFGKTSNYLYFKGYSLRECCTNCPYTSIERVGDISIGDFWGLPEDSIYEDGKGLSMLLVNSNKGLRFFDVLLASEDYIIEKHSLAELKQACLHHPSKFNPQRRFFVNDYENFGFVYVAKKYGDIGIKGKFKKAIIKILRYVGIKKYKHS